MTKKKMFWGILAATLIAGLVLFGCASDDSTGGDEWSAVKSLDQLDGTWTASYEKSQSLVDWMEWMDSFGGEDGEDEEDGEDIEDGEDEEEDIPDEIKEALAGISVKVNATMETAFDAAAKTQKVNKMEMKIAFSGKDIDSVWQFLALMFAMSGGDSEGDSIVTDNENHSITVTEKPKPAEPITDEVAAEMFEVLTINQDGTKIKVPAGLGGGYFPEEIIMTKK
jgi:hypothetical protein